MDTSAKSASISVDPDKRFQITLTARQISLVLSVLNEAHFKGSQADLVAATIAAIQDPILREAHVGKEQNS